MAGLPLTTASEVYWPTRSALSTVRGVKTVLAEKPAALTDPSAQSEGGSVTVGGTLHG